jgi:hypothetical protein
VLQEVKYIKPVVLTKIFSESNRFMILEVGSQHTGLEISINKQNKPELAAHIEYFLNMFYKILLLSKTVDD